MTIVSPLFSVRVIRDGPSRVDWNRMLAVFRKPREWRESDAPYRYAQAKCDGYRVLVSRERVISTTGHDLASQYDMRSCEWYNACVESLHPDAWIDAEMFVGDAGAETVRAKLVQREPVSLGIIGASWCDLDWSLEGTSVSLVEEGFPYLIPALDASCPSQDGVVYKDSTYGRWAKKKRRLTADLLVTRVLLGIGKYWGQCGALECADGTGRVVARVSGMDDETRSDIIASRDVGRVIEVAYERVGSAGRLRHPRFVRWRDDKSPGDCTCLT